MVECRRLQGTRNAATAPAHQACYNPFWALVRAEPSSMPSCCVEARFLSERRPGLGPRSLLRRVTPVTSSLGQTSDMLDGLSKQSWMMRRCLEQHRISRSSRSLHEVLGSQNRRNLEVVQAKNVVQLSSRSSSPQVAYLAGDLMSSLLSVRCVIAVPVTRSSYLELRGADVQLEL